MHGDPDREIASETNRLLYELELALDHSSTVRAIARHREQLYDLEGLTGPSPRTRSLRAQIHQLEQCLDAERKAAALCGGSLFPG